jgi:hypothetical protein
VRTIEQTAPLFRRHILDVCGGDIYAVIQGPISSQLFDAIVRDWFRDNLKEIEWFHRSEEYNVLQDELIERMDIAPHWKQYLKGSGSMVEYYQLYRAFEMMERAERAGGFQYEQVVRLRTDVMIAQPLDLTWSQWTPEEVVQQWNIVNGEEAFGESSLRLFMNSLFSSERVKSKGEWAENSSVIHPTVWNYLHENDERNLSEKIAHFLHNGNYLLTIRKNVFYMGNREVFSQLRLLGITYGAYRLGKYGEYWWDAESQLATICEQNDISLFNGTTAIEAKSLYHYDRANYFDGTNVLSRADLFCFICRG